MHWLLIAYQISMHSSLTVRADVGTERACDFQARQMAAAYGPAEIRKLDLDSAVDWRGYRFAWKCIPVDADGDDGRPGRPVLRIETPIK